MNLKKGKVPTYFIAKRLTVKTFRYYDIRAFSFCNLTKPFCISKYFISIQITDSLRCLWCILAHEYKVDNHR